jgi:UDP:flavonoid glycosyltransferase YjiC (YdhE family)
MRFDVVIVGDFRFPGGTSGAIVQELRALSRAGYSVGLVHKRAALLRRDRPFHPQIVAAIETGQAVLVQPQDFGAGVSCRLAVLQNPYIFVEPDPALPRIDAGQAVMVAQQPILDANGDPYYDVWTVHQAASDLVGPDISWAPISPLARRNMEAADIPYPVLNEDWTHIVFPEDWAAPRESWVGPKRVIGRHSRPDREKWPPTREDVLAVYPEGDEFDVRLLGAGNVLRELVGDPLPANWTALEFGAVEPAEFLRGIDFFVYYHHPDWVEGFGRTIAEAAASGAVVILPEYLRATFGEAALYREPADVLPTIRELAGDREAYERQSRLGQEIVDRTYGPGRFLDRIRRLIGEPQARPAAKPGRRTAVPGDRMALDVLHVADTRTHREAAWRIANQVRIEAAAGYSAGLLHVAADTPGRRATVNPMLDELVRDGLAKAVDPVVPGRKTKLLVVHDPGELRASLEKGAGSSLSAIRAERAVAVCPLHAGTEDLREHDRALKAALGPELSWAAGDADSLQVLAGLEGLAAEPDIWRPAVEAQRAARVGTRPVLGCLWAGRTSLPPKAFRRMQAHLTATDDSVIVRLMDPPVDQSAPKEAWPEAFELFKSGDLNVLRFIENLDFLKVFSNGPSSAIPGEIVASAMARGIPVLLPPSSGGRFGSGPLYVASRDVLRAVRDLYADADRLAALQSRVRDAALRDYPASVHAKRLKRLVGRGGKPSSKRRPVRRVLFLSSNGVGLGHLTRLLAIARRMPPNTAPVFATMSQAMAVVMQAGFPVEYLPFHVYANCDPRDWNDWLARHLDQIVDFHRPAAIVFDGSMPYSGLLQAAGHRSGVKLVWIRRGMWQKSQHNDEAIARQRFFDLVIEPGDIAGALDQGATATTRLPALEVPPIALLDPEELPDRAAAAERLGLDPSRPAVLIQLGSGWNRDLASMVDAILNALASRPDVQPVLVEWLISDVGLGLWPGVPRVRGFPVSRYSNAFDFTISAAGYNSFNETLAFGLPAIFVANEHPMLDDQAARAAYAAAQGAALHLPDTQIDAIGPLIETMLDPRARRRMRENALRLALPNGAAPAAAAVAELIGAGEGSA